MAQGRPHRRLLDLDFASLKFPSPSRSSHPEGVVKAVKMPEMPVCLYFNILGGPRCFPQKQSVWKGGPDSRTSDIPSDLCPGPSCQHCVVYRQTYTTRSQDQVSPTNVG